MPPSLAALRAAPHDREQLLVYADWLQSQGHPRGELIAVQDAAARTDDPRVYADARARAHAIVEAHEVLRPPAPGDRDGPTRGIWATWERGFVRSLELLVDRPSPGQGREAFAGGVAGWADLLAAIMEHPSLALVQSILLRFDLRGEPIDETLVALDMAVRGLRARLEAEGPRPSLRLDLWTHRVPSHDVRERLGAGLPGLRPSWYSRDITIFPPPQGSPVLHLERALAQAGRLPTRFDLLWFDTRGQFLARLDADSLGYQMGVDVYDPSWQVHVRRLAEAAVAKRDPVLLGGPESMPERRLAQLLDCLGSRFSTLGRSASPRRAWTTRPEAIDLGAGLKRIGALWSAHVARQLEAPLLEFDADVAWLWLAEARTEGEWLGLVGLGDDQLLVLAIIVD